MRELQVRAALRLTDAAGNKVFGPGIAALLAGVRQNGSLRRTAAEMDMSYNKAWHILRESEERLGTPLLERRTGGAHGGGSCLTAAGEDMLRRYDDFAREGQRLLDELAARCFGEEEPDG